MAYQLEYAFREFRKVNKKKMMKLNGALAAVLLAAVMVGTRFSGAAIEIILIGNQDSIRSAVSEMLTNLREGMTLNEAVYTFCEEVANEQNEN